MSRWGEERYTDDDDFDLMEYRIEAARERRLMRNPDCRDPDHPGCDCCEPPEQPDPPEADQDPIDEDSE